MPKFAYQAKTIPNTASDQTVQDALNALGADGYDVVFVGTRAIAKKMLRQPADIDLNNVLDQLVNAALTEMQDPTFPGLPYTADQITDDVKNRVRAVVKAVIQAYGTLA